MVVLKAHFDGKIFVPDEPVALAPNQKVKVTADPVEPAPQLPARTPALQRDALIRIAPDFNDHLGDDFWGLSESK